MTDRTAAKQLSRLISKTLSVHGRYHDAERLTQTKVKHFDIEAVHIRHIIITHEDQYYPSGRSLLLVNDIFITRQYRIFRMNARGV